MRPWQPQGPRAVSRGWDPVPSPHLLCSQPCSESFRHPNQAGYFPLTSPTENNPCTSAQPAPPALRGQDKLWLVSLYLRGGGGSSLRASPLGLTLQLPQDGSQRPASHSTQLLWITSWGNGAVWSRHWANCQWGGFRMTGSAP